MRLALATLLLSALCSSAAPLQITEQRRIGQVVYNVQRSTNFHPLCLRLAQRSSAGEWAAYEVKSSYQALVYAPERFRTPQAAQMPQPPPPVAYVFNKSDRDVTQDKMVLLRNIPMELDPVTERCVVVRAMRVGTTNLPTMTLEVWDCGIPELPARPQ